MKQAAKLLSGIQHHVRHLVGAGVTASIDVIGALLDDRFDGLAHARRLGKRGAAVVEIDFLHDDTYLH